ncbi:glycosyl hydrolase [Paenibacillus mucilaginosus]|uniref:Mannan endo-1,4-beta-mannosidase n=1 Tax=Paenibacillus mucilaginosus (strain KNP414) TaxID=1036673 RepID=F8F4U9_PAEMK|nr:glycosyl hydrolase [Paenibacillus mucilaginosus]AEI40679.1 Mannan endo-1,4-beta-mannosidase [Paenibacillus mucilaginosus KNP414]MCG7211833.1 S-layer homology domain-containing protein [Paenibacillus mucilaginosus]WDM29818.1 S-layer homology domain-containing protein [Paenibacillus mucilaginosus]
MKKHQAWLKACMAASLVFSAGSPAAGYAAAAVNGIPADAAGHWAKESVSKWLDHGVIQGYEDGTFGPDKRITRAEFAKIVNELFGYYAPAERPFTDIAKDAWYAAELSAAKQAGYYQGFPGGLSKAETEISRQDAVVFLARVFELKAAGVVQESGFTDADETDAYAKEAVQAFAGIVNGYEDGGFHPKDSITRAEVLALLDRLVAGYNPGGTGTAMDGHVILNKKNSVLKDAEVAGNLYIAAGVADGDAVLENVQVKGTTFISGGGEHSVNLKDSTLGEVRVNRQEGRVRTVVSGTAVVGHIELDSDTVLELEKGARVEKADVNRSALVKVAEGAGIGVLRIAPDAAGTSLSVSGNVAELKIEADRVSINGKETAKGSYKLTGGSITPAGAQTPAGGSTGGNNDSRGSGSGNSGGGDNGSGGDNGGDDSGSLTADLVDAQATEATRSLFAYLQEVRGQEILFGHQHATDEGFSIQDPMGTGSDVRQAVGDYPAIFGWDTLSLQGDEKPGVPGDTAQSRDRLLVKMKQAHELGGLLALSMHPSNFVTGGKYNDTTGNVAENVLPGGKANAAFTAYLDLIADFALKLKDDEGTPIPLIFRVFHEQNGGWFWWGAKTTPTEQYIELYRYTVEYLRDTKGVHNLLYAWSPNGPFGGDSAKYLTTYPGDAYVDILGMDQYDNQAAPGTEAFLNALVDDLRMISEVADSKGKIAALTEYGYSPQGMKTTGNGDLAWFSKVLGAIQSDPAAKRMAYMQTWANFGLNSNLFVPYSGHPELGDHELLLDFKAFYNDPYSSFLGEVGEVTGRKVTPAEEAPVMHAVTPVEQGTVTTPVTKVRAKVLHTNPDRVVFTPGGSPDEIPMTLDAEGYYSADWKLDPGFNGKTAEYTVKVYKDGAVTHEETNLIFVKVEEMLMHAYTFNDGIEGFQSNGGYQASVTSIGHADFAGSGRLQLNVTDTVYTDTWQELKLELTSAAGDVNLADVKRVKLQFLIPVEAGQKSADASLQAVAMLPPDWDTKYGMNTTARKLSELETVTVGDAVYAVYPASIDLTSPELSAAASGLALSIAGSGLEYSGPMYLDNVELYSVYHKAPQDPSVVDDFEGYQGLDAGLQTAFVSASGDGASVSLAPGQARQGLYAMKYQYKLGSAGYAGVNRLLGSRDWSGANQLQFWLTPDGQNQKLVIQLKVDGTYFEYYPATDQSIPHLEEIPFAAFVPVHGGTGQLTKTKLKNVQEFSIYTNAVNGAKLESAMYFDDIRAVLNPDAPSVPNGGSGPGSSAAQPGILYDFETDTGGWILEQNQASATAPAVTADAAASGSSALSSSFSLAGGAGFELAKVEALDLSAVDSISVRVKLSAGQANARLYVKTGSDWVWHDSGASPVDSSGFVMVSIPVASLSNPDLVQSIGVKIEPVGGSGPSVVYVDEVRLNAPE